MRFVYGFLRLWPLCCLKALFRTVVLLVYLILSKRRRITQNNIRYAIGGDYKKLALRSYLYFADMVAFNVKYLQNRAFIEKHFNIEGYENYLKAKSLGRGVIFTTAHFGNWEMLVCAFAVLKEPINIMVRPIDNKSVDELVESIRSSCENKVLSSRMSAFEFIRMLKKGEVLGILIDQAGGDGSFKVNFFGRKAKVSESVGVFACKLGVPVLPAYLKEENNSFTIVIEKAILCDRDKPKREAIQEVMDRVYERFEAWIKSQPHKYFWMHNRWK
ncbi:lysophospholipid acyltransferase family protein [Hippea maritima]|uniref:Lipid A biosynthesis acyltransferase n=1 Tax=Hippea maritima (strain ATCC 700847 / DSM 10411 / MH2) TaxID=760142 RepID=F2LU16_HIPMA|nr:lysophospholipid acyltransferase family protein [Hippea maritima]AEA33415.1 lipid A biosynthesis acyltransferase [Hippea maritima DSM 10411]